MNAAAAGLALVFLFGVLASAGLLALWVGEYRSRRTLWFGPPGAAALGFCAAWFAANVALVMLGPAPELPLATLLDRVTKAMSFFFAPLMMHVHYFDRASALRADPHWRLPIGAAYAAGAVLAVATFLRADGVGGAAPVRDLLQVGQGILFVAAGIVSVASFLALRREPRVADGRGYADWNLFLFALAALVLLPWVLAPQAAPASPSPASMSVRALPLCFLGLAAYYQRRFAFFDLLVKRGLYVAITIVLL
ncbi:MAG: hypothetical protein ACREQ9_19740, partial [Candidatus Binatia bacterium]